MTAGNFCAVNGLGDNPVKGSTPDESSKFRPGILIPHGVTLEEAELLILRATLDRCFGNKTRAAEALGISLKTVYNILNKAKVPL